MIKIFVSGPYDGDVDINVGLAVVAGEKLARMGFIPFIPHAMGFVWHEFFPHDREFWLALDKEWLRSCDAVFRIPGKSPGADEECELARTLGIPVFYEFEKLNSAKNSAKKPIAHPATRLEAISSRNNETGKITFETR